MHRAEVPFGDYLSYLEMHEEKQRNGKGDDGDEELAYLAQNDLPPALFSDLEVPELCDDASHGIGKGRRYSTMLWLGPMGTVSPLHHDPLDNLLMQIVGRKRVWLYPRTAGSLVAPEGDWMYAGHDGTQGNASPVDVEDPASWAERYPRFATGAPPPLEAVLEPGDVLYIPAKWWHHVRSLSMSLSVNVWWR